MDPRATRDAVELKVCEVCGNLKRPRTVHREISDGDEDSIADDADEEIDGYVSFPPQKLSRVYQSGQEGCVICAVLVEIYRFYMPHAKPGVAKLQIRFPKWSGCLELVLHDLGAYRTLQLYSTDGEGKNHIDLLMGREFVSNRDSPKALEWIKKRLQTCLEGHVSCRSPALKLPTRVLDVGGENSDSIRLVESTHMAFEPYVALSYCWGQDSAMIKTTTNNVKTFQAGIGIAEFPVVFQQCFSLARSLGVRLVWIDALCIIQDNREDWERESAVMSGIYTNAHLTIAASMSPSTSAGFLSGSYNDSKGPPLTKDFSYEGGPGALRARLIPEVGIHSKWTHWLHERHLQRHEPWSQRGWILQEELLSQRLLMFTSAEMQWSCQEYQTCECESPLNHRRLFGGQPIGKTILGRDTYNFWHKAVENYSTRRLTNRTDILPAISGIAHAIGERTRDSYVAGLWHTNIDEDLLWERVGVLQIQSDYLAPSFSWASTTGEVDYRCYMNGKFRYNKAAEVISVSAQAIGHNPFGTVSSGEIVVRGLLIPATLVARETKHLYAENSYVVRLGGKRISFTADTVLATMPNTWQDVEAHAIACKYRPEVAGPHDAAGSPGRPAQELTLSTDVKDIVPHTVQIHDGTRCWLLQMGAYEPPNSSKEVIKYLVLGKPAARPEKFERLGLLTSGKHLFGLSAQDAFRDKATSGQICIV